MRLKNNFFLITSTLLVFLIFFLPPLDTDLGWHLRYGGEWIRGILPHVNSFSYYLTDYFWNNSNTLFDILAFAVNQSFGLLGLTLLNSILASFAYILFSSLHKNLSKISLFVYLGIVLFGWNVFSLGLRSQVFSFAFIIFVFFVIKKAEEKKYWLYFLPPLFLLWANTHGAFILGFLPIVAEILNLVRLKERRQAVNFSVVGLLSFAATFINPYGLGIYKETWIHFSVPLGGLIAEWVPPDLLIQIGIIFAALAVFVLILPKNPKNWVFWVVLLTPFSYLAFSERRNLPYFALVFTLFIVETFKDKFARLENNKNFKYLAFTGAAAGVLILLAVRVPQTILLSTNWALYCENSNFPYPCGATEFIKTHNIQGQNVFTAYEWGGFLEWQLPQYKYFVDGRMPAWPTPEGKSPYTVYLETIQAQPGYQETLGKHKTDWLLIGSGSFLDIELSQKKNSIWKEIYRDPLSVIYTKK